MHLHKSILLLAGLWAPVLAGKLEAGDPAPAFELRTLDNTQKVRYAGKSPTVMLLDFWASYCRPCRRTLPLLDRLHAKYPQVQVFTISQDFKQTSGMHFLQLHQVDLPALFDSGKKVADQFGVAKLPTMILIAADGEILRRWNEYDEEDFKEINGAVLEALGLPAEEKQPSGT